MKRALLFVLAFLSLASVAQAQEFFANRYPPAYAWANRPTCGTAGDRIYITDVGIGGSTWLCDGTEWHPTGPVILARNTAAITDTSGTTEFNMAVVTIPAGLLGTSGGLEVEAIYTFTGSTNSKTCQVRLGTTSGATAGTSLISGTTTTAANLAYKARATIRNRGSASSQYAPTASFSTAWGFANNAGSTTSTNTASAVYVNFNAVKATGGETMQIEYYDVRLIP